MNRHILSILFVALFGSILHAGQGDNPKKKTAEPKLDGLKALKHMDPKVRYRAAQTLGDLGPQAKFASEALHEALTDKHPLVRLKVVEALWKIEQTSSAVLIPVLLDSIKNKDAGVRAAVPRVIALMGTKGAKSGLPALEAALKDKDFEVKMAVITALGDLGPIAKDKAGALLNMTSDADFALLEPFVAAALSNLGDAAIPKLTQALADKSPDRQRIAVYALGSMGPKAASASADIAKVLQVEDIVLRSYAARALGKIGPNAKAALPALEKALTDPAAAVRIDAALATWLVTKDAKHVPVLVKALGDESPSVRESACQALAAMKADAKAAVDSVAKLLGDKELRLRAVITLGEIGKQAAKMLPDLQKLLKDKDGEIQLHAAFAVWQISGDGKESMKIFEELLGTEKYYTPTINVLGEMGAAAEGLLPTLVALYREEDVPADRLALANAIKKIDPKAAMKLGIK